MLIYNPLLFINSIISLGVFSQELLHVNLPFYKVVIIYCKIESTFRRKRIHDTLAGHLRNYTLSSVFREQLRPLDWKLSKPADEEG